MRVPRKIICFRTPEKNSGGKVDKRDVQKYLKKQNQEEEPVNTALAEALKKLNLK